MIDKKEEKHHLVPPVAKQDRAADLLPGLNKAPEKANPLTRPEMSEAEQLYNRIVYWGVNYWLNLGLSMYVTDIFTHGQGAGDFTKGGAKRFFDKGVATIAAALNHGKMSQKAAIRAAEVILGTFTLNTGGNVVLLPMLAGENHKREIVHWMMKNVTHENLIAADGHEMTPEEIYIEQEQPKQSLPRVIGRRALAIASTIVTGLAMDWGLRRKLEPHEVTQGKHGLITHEEGNARFQRWITTGTDKVLNSGYVPGGPEFSANPVGRRYIGYAALDWLYTLITSKVMHVTNGAKKARMPHEIGDEVDPPGIDKNDEIEIMPESPKPDERQALAMARRPSPESFKKKPIAPMENYVALSERSGEPEQLSP